MSVQSSSYYADVIDAANFLSDRDLVPNYSSNPAQYQLNDMITRQELLTMILKAMKIAPASGYQCQNIFSDISDPEICATAETALANGLISKQTNEDGVSFFRGTDFLTLYEMFVLTMKSQCMRSEDVSLSGVREKV